jgi:CMP-N-acetylneuraminic acid synthetase
LGRSDRRSHFGPDRQVVGDNCAIDIERKQLVGHTILLLINCEMIAIVLRSDQNMV